MNARHDAFAEQVRYLDSLGPRVTGGSAHGALVENVAEQLTGLGLTVHRDPHRFTRWNAPRDSTHLNLTVGVLNDTTPDDVAVVERRWSR